MSESTGGLLDRVWATLFPARCAGCGRRDTPLCPPCRAALPLLSGAVCARCSLPPRPGRPGQCPACRHIPAALAAVRAACAYEGVARAMVHTLKFRSGQYLASAMGDLMATTVAIRPLRADLVVPVPLASARLRERGYNQAELLARSVGDVVGGTLAADVLGREERRAQRTLPAAERRTNLKHAFHVTVPGTVTGKRILLVDDVLTTGATLGECAETLRDAGAAWVGGLVFARDL